MTDDDGLKQKKEYYKDSLNLPKTEFPQKAKLGEREPHLLKFWQENNIYQKLLESNSSESLFVFHDGPPYANGHIHYGTILNKILKDFVVKYQNIKGKKSKFIPGWDCHGLPIEMHVEREHKDKKTNILEMRKHCKEFAEKWYKIQRDEFVRLGIFATWEQPYLTMNPSYEEVIIKSVGAYVKNGSIYRGEKPVYWCTHDHTALAEAEVEYHSHKSPSIYVKYPVIDKDKFIELCNLKDDGDELNVLIWTTTPWTLPASLAIAIHPDYEYSFYKIDKCKVLMADYLAPKLSTIGIKHEKVGKTLKGVNLENLRCKHPFLDVEIPMLLADYVTLDAGTGCVHTAPGHGQDDYVLGSQHGIPPYAPVDDEGKFTKEVDNWAGMSVWDANPLIVEYLHKIGRLLNKPGEFIEHQYPCCWRCKNPIVFRATPQWFISMDRTGLRRLALEVIDKVNWIPSWGRDRIRSMMEVRPDWCISRQRIWGVPIPFFYCKECGNPLINEDVIENVAALIGKKGSDVWFALSAEELMPPNIKCKECGSKSFEKDNNILDVWFESGVSWAAVCLDTPDHDIPVDLYLEGSDQHRGWFHTSLLTGIGIRGDAPYKSVLTHGFVIDEAGKPYSKSEIAKRKASGEKIDYVEPEQFYNEFGAELLRLWTMSEDFTDDIKFGPSIIKGLKDAYFKIRNTFRFFLGNINDFDPQQAVPYEELEEVDKWALARFAKFIDQADEYYSTYEYHRIYHLLMDLLSVELSAFYLDILKDRLYCESKQGKRRRSAQTALYYITRDLTRVLCPLISFTMEEVWNYLPGKDKEKSVFLSHFPQPPKQWFNEDLIQRWRILRNIRTTVNKELEEIRSKKIIGSSLDAKVVLKTGQINYDILEQYKEILNEILIVSKVELIHEEGLSEDLLIVDAGKAEGNKCIRCWNIKSEVGNKDKYPELCHRCQKVMEEIEKK